jgi:hypothetical protein
LYVPFFSIFHTKLQSQLWPMWLLSNAVFFK